MNSTDDFVDELNLGNEEETRPAEPEVNMDRLLDTRSNLPIGPIIDISETFIDESQFSFVNISRMSLISGLNDFTKQFKLHSDLDPIDFEITRRFTDGISDFVNNFEKNCPEIYTQLSSQFVALREKASALAVAMDPRTIKARSMTAGYLFEAKVLANQINKSLRTVSVIKSDIEAEA